LASTAPAAERTVPVHPALGGVFPQGLVRGSTVACVGAAASSASALLLAGPVQAGSWGCVVGLPTFGPGAAAEAGVALERVVVVREPGSAGFDESTWAQVLAAAIDGFDVVVHSTTKYIGGHSDVVGGAVIVNDDELAEKIGFVQFAVGAVSGW
jgi:hypothetical protein